MTIEGRTEPYLITWEALGPADAATVLVVAGFKTVMTKTQVATNPNETRILMFLIIGFWNEVNWTRYKIWNEVEWTQYKS